MLHVRTIFLIYMSRFNCCQLHPEGSLLESGLLLSHWCDPIAYQFSFFPQRETLSCCVNVSPFYVCVNEGGLMEPHLIMKEAQQVRKGNQTWIRRIHLFKVLFLQEKTCSGGQIRYGIFFNLLFACCATDLGLFFQINTVCFLFDYHLLVL